jgi:hypothetical protein
VGGTTGISCLKAGQSRFDFGPPIPPPHLFTEKDTLNIGQKEGRKDGKLIFKSYDTVTAMRNLVIFLN